MHDRRRGYSLMEMAVVLFLIGLVTGITVFSFRGGEATGSARVAQATLDATLDGAVNASLGRAKLDAITPRRLASDLPEVAFVGWDATDSKVAYQNADGTGTALVDLRDPDAPEGAVWLHVDDVTKQVSAATLSSEGYCFVARLSMGASVGQAPRRYGVIKDGSPIPCTGYQAAGLLAGDVLTGTAWSSPAVFG